MKFIINYAALNSILILINRQISMEKPNENTNDELENSKMHL